MSQPEGASNLEIRCAEVGQELANIGGIQERILNNALSVLEEQGPYAMFLYLKTRHQSEATAFWDSCKQFLKQVFGDKITENADAVGVIKNLSENLDDLLFARDLLRTAIGYARFYLKAKGG